MDSTDMDASDKLISSCLCVVKSGNDDDDAGGGGGSGSGLVTEIGIKDAEATQELLKDQILVTMMTP